MEKRLFSGRLRADWGNTTRAATGGLGSIGFISVEDRTRKNMVFIQLQHEIYIQPVCYNKTGWRYILHHILQA